MSDTLTLDTLLDAACKLGKLPCVSIVCRPDMIGELRALEKPVPVESPLMCGVPLYTKADQVEPWRVFYDDAALRLYLNPPAP